MKPKCTICILLTAAALLVVSGCIAQEKTGSDSLKNYLPQGKSLPDGFKLIVIEDKSIQGLNMTEEIKEFYGSKEIGPVNATIARYNQSSLGFNYDGKVTVISLADADHAKAAVSNYLENFKSSNTVVLPGNRSLINKATINSHKVTEIGKITGDNMIQFKYLWSNNTIAVLVDGNYNRTISMKLASATGL